jgi:vacuolar-type H+-ATPase subunit F/Vma7
MSRVVAIGEEAALAGYALAGVEVVGAVDPAAVVDAWKALDADVGLVLLTAAARSALEGILDRASLAWVALPA